DDVAIGMQAIERVQETKQRELPDHVEGKPAERCQLFGGIGPRLLVRKLAPSPLEQTPLADDRHPEGLRAAQAFGQLAIWKQRPAKPTDDHCVRAARHAAAGPPAA